MIGIIFLLFCIGSIMVYIKIERDLNYLISHMEKEMCRSLGILYTNPNRSWTFKI